MSGLAVLAIQSQQVLVCNYIIRLQRSDELMRESRAEQPGVGVEFIIRVPACRDMSKQRL